MKDEVRKLFRRASEVELRSWLDHKVHDVVNKKVADKDRVVSARWGSTRKAKARICVLGFQDPDLTEVHRNRTTLSAHTEALILQCVASNKWQLVS